MTWRSKLPVSPDWRVNPNQMKSVFLKFICNRLDEHHRLISATHCCNGSAVVVDAITCVSSAYKTELLAVDQVCQVFRISNKLYGTQHRSLWDTAIHRKRARLWSIYAESLWTLTEVRLAPIQRPVSDGETPVHYLQQYLVVEVDGVNGVMLKQWMTNGIFCSWIAPVFISGYWATALSRLAVSYITAVWFTIDRIPLSNIDVKFVKRLWVDQ